MSSAAEILVIILSVFLAFFLILGIILTIYLIKLTHEIRKVTKSAEKTVDDIGSAVSGITRIISPIFVTSVINRIIRNFKKKGEK